MNKIEYNVNEKILSIIQPNGEIKSTSFRCPIVQVLAYSDVLVVRLEPPPKTCFNENVYGVLSTGEIAWQVGKRKYIYKDSPYTGIESIDNKVKLFNWDGLELILEPMTGKEISEAYGK